MTPERWARVKEIVGAALEKPAAERRAFLDGACGGENWLRAEADRLLAQAAESLESPLASLAAPELQPGQMLGRYRVEAKLGQGGMGTVYRAHDSQLQRPVALKVLPPEYAADPNRRERLQREARAASALNHPNIIGIYEIGSDAGVDFIAMELVEGRSLAELIPAKGMAVKEALAYAVQMAGALGKAHAAGIVHRDLKPANAMVTRDGLVKLLDFGLARRTHVPDRQTSTLTQEGSIAGTPAYMSPEQAEGKGADARSDVFSFGVLLYEMLSGRRAFAGDSTVAILSAVLREEPPPLRGVPEELAAVVSRCLRKDPARRFQHMDDVKLFLEEVPVAAPVVSAPRRSRRLAYVGAGVALAVAGFAAWRSYAPARGEMRVLTLTSYAGVESAPSFSPDGRQVAFHWNGEDQKNFDIYVKVVGSTAAPLRVTTDAAADVVPAWSPDGRQIAFIRNNEGSLRVYLVSPLGGDERNLADLPYTSTAMGGQMAMSWSADGKWLALSERPAQGNWGISLLSIERLEKRAVTSNATGIDFSPAFSSDSRSLAYVSCPARTAMNCHVYLQELDDDFQPHGRPRQLTHENVYIGGLSWAPDGRSLLYTAASCFNGPTPLWRVAVSGGKAPERVELPGPDVQGVAVARAANRLAYGVHTSGSDIWSYRAGAPPRRIIASTGTNYYHSLSEDGGRIAFATSRTGCMEVWISKQDGSGAARLPCEVGHSQGSPRWSPDGRWIAFDSLGEDGRIDVYVVDAAGGQPRRLTPPSTDESVPSWSRDGRWVYFRSNRTGRNEIWKAPFEGGEALQVTFQGGYTARESWDGTTLYYVKDAAAGPMFAAPVAGGPERRIADLVLGRGLVPSADGVYFLGRDGAEDGPSAVKKYDFKTGTTQTVRRLEEYSSGGLAVSPDGKEFLVSIPKPFTADLMLIENFR